MDESVEIKSGNLSAKATGPQTVLVIVLAAATFVFCWFVYDRSVFVANAVAQHEAKAEIRGNRIVIEQQARLEGKFDEVTYMLALTPEERARLRLSMPESMRKKLLEQERR